MTYCISDIHGCYDEFMELLRKIEFGPDDTLYVLGDAIDRGEASIKCLQYIMDTPGIHMLTGNHEKLMIDALSSDYENDESAVSNWFGNGGAETFRELCKLSEEEQGRIIEFVTGLPYLEQVKLGEQNYVLVHAGLNVADAALKGDASTATVIHRQYQEDLVWIREKFIRKKALPRSITVFGHTPIPMIKKRNGAKVWRDERFHDKIGIDGGCVYGGYLLALRLDDMAEFAVEAMSAAHKFR